MIRLIVVALAALYFVLHVFGDESRRPEVTRAEPAGLGLGLIMAAYVPTVTEDEMRPVTSGISDMEAIRLALDAGVVLRAERKGHMLRGSEKLAMAENTTGAVVPAATNSARDYWYVTGSRVNLRNGPGTDNAVVGQLTMGTEAEVLSDQNGWYQIRTADGATSGWIHSKFLDTQRPG